MKYEFNITQSREIRTQNMSVRHIFESQRCGEGGQRSKTLDWAIHIYIGRRNQSWPAFSTAGGGPGPDSARGSTADMPSACRPKPPLCAAAAGGAVGPGCAARLGCAAGG